MKKQIIKLIIASVFLIVGLITINYNSIVALCLFILSLLIAGGEVILKAIKNILNGKVFDESFLMSVATIGAFFIGEYAEGVAVMIFYLVGEIFQDYAVGKSRKSIAALMEIKPDFANYVDENGNIEKVDPEKLNIGDTIVIKSGEKVPVDAKVLSGESSLDVSALTGESLPKSIFKDVEILSGSINIDGVIYAEVTRRFEDSTVHKILELVENASNKKSKSEKFISKFAAIYTPIVVIIALLLALIPPLAFGQSFDVWVYRALSFLVVSCPCALVVSIPLSFFSGIGAASKNGILIKGSNYIELLAKANNIVFDKTGTLTKGTFNVVKIVSKSDFSESQILELAAYAENFSTHPIAVSLKKAYEKEIAVQSISDIKEIAGRGVSAVINGKSVLVGNHRLMESSNIEYFKGEEIGTLIHVSCENKYLGYIVIADEIKSDSFDAIKSIKSEGIQVAMLTGDTEYVAKYTADSLGINNAYWGLLPQDKVEKLESLLSSKPKNSTVAFVGDGINDAPVLTRADVGIAMGAIGSDAAIEAADVVIMTDELSKIVTAIKISKKTLSIAKQNIIFSISIKVIVLILSTLGIATMWDAVFADVGVTVIAILNSFRAMKK